MFQVKTYEKDSTGIYKPLFHKFYMWVEVHEYISNLPADARIIEIKEVW